MKALSIRQPHANNILTGRKTIELRTWSTKYRGDLLLVSSLKADAGATDDLPRGVAICIARLVDCRQMRRKDCRAAMVDILYTNAYSWILEDVRPVDPFPVKGRLGLFEVEMSV